MLVAVQYSSDRRFIVAIVMSFSASPERRLEIGVCPTRLQASEYVGKQLLRLRYVLHYRDGEHKIEHSVGKIRLERIRSHKGRVRKPYGARHVPRRGRPEAEVGRYELLSRIPRRKRYRPGKIACADLEHRLGAQKLRLPLDQLTSPVDLNVMRFR